MDVLDLLSLRFLLSLLVLWLFKSVKLVKINIGGRDIFTKNERTPHIKNCCSQRSLSLFCICCLKPLESQCQAELQQLLFFRFRLWFTAFASLFFPVNILRFCKAFF